MPACSESAAYKLHADARHHMARLDDKRTALRQLRAHRQRLGEIVGDKGQAEPVVQHRAQTGVVDAHQRQQRAQAWTAFAAGAPASGGA